MKIISTPSLKILSNSWAQKLPILVGKKQNWSNSIFYLWYVVEYIFYGWQVITYLLMKWNVFHHQWYLQDYFVYVFFQMNWPINVFLEAFLIMRKLVYPTRTTYHPAWRIFEAANFCKRRFKWEYIILSCLTMFCA